MDKGKLQFASGAGGLFLPAHRHQPAALIGAAGVHGEWHARCVGAVTFADEDEAGHILQSIGHLDAADDARIWGFLHAPRIQQALALCPDPGTRRRLEALLEGGDTRWEEQFYNIVVNEGLDDLLDVTLSGATQDTTWFVGLKATGTPAAADTLASHASWAEVTDYAGNRKAWVDGGVSSQSVDNTASPASFAINATVTVFGAFLGGVDTGTAGALYAAGDFAASRAVINGDTLDVDATFTTAAA